MIKRPWKNGLAILAILAVVGCQKTVGSDAQPPLRDIPNAAAGAAATVVEASGTPATATPAVSASPSGPPGKPLENTLLPLPDKTGRFPVLTKKTTIKMSTSGGEVMIEIYPEAAPNACKHFVELIESGFYDDTPVSRVVKSPAPFVAQFGINWRPPHNKKEKEEFKDDPSYFALEKGTLCFAKAGIDHNSTQVFINYRQNNSLAAPQYGFTAFGKVIGNGMDIVDNFPSVGEPDSGLDQYRLWTDGGNYLESLTIKPAMIEKMTVVKP